MPESAGPPDARGSRPPPFSRKTVIGFESAPAGQPGRSRAGHGGAEPGSPQIRGTTASRSERRRQPAGANAAVPRPRRQTDISEEDSREGSGTRGDPPTGTGRSPGATDRLSGVRRAASALYRTRPGKVLLAVGVAWLLAVAGVIPEAWRADTQLVLLVTLATVGLWFARPILRWLLYPVRRKLAVSYVFIGLVPVVLLTLFFLLTFYVTLGQFGFYALQASLTTRGWALEEEARRVLDGIGPDSPPADIEALLDGAVENVSSFAPGAHAYFLPSDDDAGRFASAAPGGPIGPGDGRSDARLSDYRGAVRAGDSEWFGSVASRPRTGERVAILAPLGTLLRISATDEDLAIHQISPVYPDGDDLAPDDLGDGPEAVAPDPDGRWTVGWWAPLLLDVSSWDPDGAGGTVVVRFGFAPMHLIQGTTIGLTEPLAANRTDFGSSLLLGLGALGIVFLLFEAAGLLMGMHIARSITRSVEALSSGTESVRRGNFGHQVATPSDDQLGDMAKSFNIMSAQIEDDITRLRRAAHLETEMETARESQARLLPPEGSVSVPGFSVAAVCRPATEVGGDYYDLIRLDRGRLGVVIADVSGTGARAAFYMAEMKGLILGLSRVHSSPGRVLAEANRVLYESLDARTFITTTYAIFDSEDRRVTFARAGHSPLLRLSAANGQPPRAEALAPGGLGLALDPGPRFDKSLEEWSAPLRNGETFLFFTDGISEAMNAESDLFGEERLMRILEDHAGRELPALQRAVEDEVRRFTGQSAQTDDVTMVLVRTTAP